MEKSKIQREIVESLPEPCHGLLNLAPRVGKTKIGIDVIKRQKPKKILWVTPNTKLRDIDIPAEFKKWRALTYLKRTDIICWASLSSYRGEYDIVILDEYQDITENNARPLLKGLVTYKNIVGLSGTHPEHIEKLEIYRKLGLSILVNMTIDEAVGKKLIAPYRITVIECDLESRVKTVKSGSKAKPFMTTEEKQYAYYNRVIAAKLYANLVVPKFYYLNRMRFIYNLKSKNEFAKKLVKKLSGRTLVFTGEIAQAESISKYTYHSKTDDIALNKFIDGKINTLACVNAGGVGFTFRDVKNFVIVQVNSDKKGDATQKIARSLVLQDNYVANIYILVAAGTIDEKWKDKVLEGFDMEKVEHVSSKSYG